MLEEKQKMGDRLTFFSASLLLSHYFPPFSAAVDSIFAYAPREFGKWKLNKVEIDMRIKNTEAYFVRSLEWYGGWIGSGVYPILSPLLKQKHGYSATNYGVGLNVQENPSPASAIGDLFGFSVVLSRQDAVRIRKAKRDVSLVYYSKQELQKKRMWFRMVLNSRRIGVELSKEEIQWMKDYYTVLETNECERELKSQETEEDRWVALFLVGPVAYFNENCKKHAHCEIFKASQWIYPLVISSSFPASFWLSAGISEVVMQRESSWLKPILKKEYEDPAAHGLNANKHGFIELTINYNDEQSQRKCLREGCEAKTSDCEFSCLEVDDEAQQNARLEAELDPDYVEKKRNVQKRKRGS